VFPWKNIIPRYVKTKNVDKYGKRKRISLSLDMRPKNLKKIGVGGECYFKRGGEVTPNSPQINEQKKGPEGEGKKSSGGFN